MTVRLEWRPRNLWIGASWDVREEQAGYYRILELWVGVPLIALHFSRRYLNKTGRRLP